MFDKPIDFKKLHKELSSTYKRQLAIKKEYPHPYQYPPTDDYFTKRVLYNKRVAEDAPWRNARSEFNRLSSRMTMLCCILNHAKGKLHMTTYNDYPFTLEKQAKFVSRHWEEFIKSEDDTEVAA